MAQILASGTTQAESSSVVLADNQTLIYANPLMVTFAAPADGTYTARFTSLNAAGTQIGDPLEQVVTVTHVSVPASASVV